MKVLVFSEVRVSIGMGEQTILVSGKVNSLEDIKAYKNIEKLFSAFPPDTIACVSFVTYGYGEGEKFDADETELKYLEKKYTKSYAQLIDSCKPVASGEFKEPIGSESKEG